jgi:ketosteroid isomerase-like protein
MFLPHRLVQTDHDLQAGLQAPEGEMMTDETVLKALNEEYVRAFLECDVDWYQRHLADDFVCIESDGSLLDKAQFLRATAKPHDVVSFDLKELRIRFFGDVALIHARGLFTHEDGRTGTSRYTDVYARFGDEWKTVSAQITHA